MFYQRTYLDKCATIVKGSRINTGLNPVSDLLWGKNNSRLLVHFGHNRIKSLVEDKTYPDISKLHHRLKMTNAGSIDMSELHKIYGSQIDGSSKRRASSFDLIFFLIPEMWDNGKGFDYTKNHLNSEYYDKNSYDYELYRQEEGANWFEARRGYNWKEEPMSAKTSDSVFDFNISTSKNHISYTGDTVIFTYYCTSNNIYNNTDLTFKQINPQINNPAMIGTPVYFSKKGQICHTDEQKRTYCSYIQIPVTFKENELDSMRKFKFRTELTVDGKTYRSNPFALTQLGKNDTDNPIADDGIYSTKTLEEELSKFEQGKDSIIVARQHFDIGNENIDVDITDTFNAFINGEKQNHGIGIAFSPKQEYSDSVYENYIGILTNNTNSFFEPYVETTYDDTIEDDRANFILGKENRLYLYSTIGGNLENLDKLPTCSVEGTQYDVKQASKGIYYIDIRLPFNAFTAPTMLYDVWDGLMYNGEELKAVELEFTTKQPGSYFNIGTALPDKLDITPTAYGISDNETIKRGDIRKLNVLCRTNYTKNVAEIVDNVEIRMYVMDGTAQLEVIPYMKMDRTFSETFSLIDTSLLIPNTYYVDVRINSGIELKIYHDILHFRIVDDANNKYE